MKTHGKKESKGGLTMALDDSTLLASAKAVVNIPEHYRLAMADNTPKGEAPRERTYIWEDPHSEDSNIEVSLSLETGDLMSLYIRTEKEEADVSEVSTKAVRAAANAFVKQHLPGCEQFTRVRIDDIHNEYTVEYRMEVGGLELPDTGCTLRINRDLRVVRYRKEASSAMRLPEWPAERISPDTARRTMIQELCLVPVIAALYPGDNETTADTMEHRLVYEPVTIHRKYDAVSGEPLQDLLHALYPPTRPISEFNRSGPNVQDDAMKPDKSAGYRGNVSLNNMDFNDWNASLRYWETVLGIDSSLYALGERKDDGEQLYLFYTERESAEERTSGAQEDPLSVDGYMSRRWGQALNRLKASHTLQIEKSTGQLVSYYTRVKPDRMKRKKPSFTRAECWEKAQQFLHQCFPEYINYLQLELDQQEEKDPEREFFHLPLFIGPYRVRLESVTISICSITGEVLMYRGVSMEKIRELAQNNFIAKISEEEAARKVEEQLEVSMRWYLDGDDNSGRYRLIYEPAVKRSNSLDGTEKAATLQYVDAVSGELIWRLDMKS